MSTLAEFGSDDTPDDDQDDNDELETPDDAQKIDFQAAADRETGSWIVSGERDSVIVDDAPGWFSVEVDGRDPQKCYLRRVESGEWVGVCSCDDWDVKTSDHDRVMPCVDLCSLRRSLFLDEVSLDDRLDDRLDDAD